MIKYIKILLIFYTILIILLALISICTLYIVKYNTREKIKILNQIETSIIETKKNTQILNSEFAYLARPQHIHDICNKFLNLQQITEKNKIEIILK